VSHLTTDGKSRQNGDANASSSARHSEDSNTTLSSFSTVGEWTMVLNSEDERRCPECGGTLMEDHEVVCQKCGLVTPDPPTCVRVELRCHSDLAYTSPCPLTGPRTFVRAEPTDMRRRKMTSDDFFHARGLERTQTRNSTTRDNRTERIVRETDRIADSKFLRSISGTDCRSSDQQPLSELVWEQQYLQ